MNFALNRRSFLKHAALTAGALRLLPVPNLLAAADAGDKLNCVQIGCGGRGMNHLDWIVNQSKENLVAIVDAGREAPRQGQEVAGGQRAGRRPSCRPSPITA